VPQDPNTPEPRELRDRALRAIDRWLTSEEVAFEADHGVTLIVPFTAGIRDLTAAARDLTEIVAVTKTERVVAEGTITVTVDSVAELAKQTAIAGLQTHDAEATPADCEAVGDIAKQTVLNLHAEGSL
jgi:hypothetical protein